MKVGLSDKNMIKKQQQKKDSTKSNVGNQHRAMCQNFNNDMTTEIFKNQ